MMKHRAVATSVILAIVLCSLGFSTQAHAQSRLHQVEQGDTLSSLAQTFLGSSNRWREIWAANPDLRNPNQIKAGTQLIIHSGIITQHTSANTHPSLEKYQLAALEVLNSGVYQEIVSNRLLINQKDLNQQLHITAIHSSDSVTLVASSHKPITANRFLILRENQQLHTSSGLIIDARILGDAESSNTSNTLMSLTVNSAKQPLNRSEIIVLAQRMNSNSGDAFIHTPVINAPASVLHTLHNQSAGLVVIVDSGINHTLNTGAVLRYKNPGSSRPYDGVLVVINGINGAAYAAVVSSKAPPMPTASVF